MDQTKLLNCLLDFADAASGVLPWCVAPIHFAGLVALTDCRDDADLGIMAAVSKRTGGEVLCEAIHSTSDGRTILGLLVKPTDDDLDEYAMTLRTAYVYATGPDPEMLEPPF